MEDVRIKLSALWAAALFAYQQGDVRRLYSGDLMPGGDVGGMRAHSWKWPKPEVLESIGELQND